MHGLDNLSHRFHLVAELSGWAGAAFGGLASLWGFVSPDLANRWWLVICGGAVGGVSAASAIYIRLVKTQAEGQALRTIYKANEQAYLAGKPLPSPEFWAKAPKSK